MSINDMTTPPAILIQGTHGADNPEKATLPFKSAGSLRVTFSRCVFGPG